METVYKNKNKNVTQRRFLAIIVNSDRFNNATPQNGNKCS